MAAGDLGTIRGQLILDVKQALASYTSARQAHVATVTALHTGAGAMAASGAIIAGAGAAMVGGFLAAVGAAAEFERKLDFFGAVSASTTAEMEQIRAAAIKLGQDTIYSANQIADSFVELGKAGVSAQDIVGGVGKAVASIGSAADIPLDTAANIITAAVQTFNLSADQAVMVADKLAGAANASIVEVSDLGTSLKYVGGVAATFGLKFADVNTALALLGKAGIRGSTAGTSLRQTLTSLNGATKAAQGELRTLGIITADGSNKFFDLQGNLKPLPQVFQVLQDAMKGLSAEQQVSAIKTIFQQRAISSVAALTKAGASGFEQMSAAIDKTTAAEVAGKRLNNLSGDIEILRGNIDTLVLSAGGGFQSVARVIVQAVTHVIGTITSLPAWAQTSILATIAAFGGILIIVGTLGIFAGAILNIIALAEVMGPVFVALGAAMRAVAGSMAALNIALAQNPIVRIIAIIGLLVGIFITLYNTNQKFHDAVQPLFDQLIAIFIKLGPIIQQVMGWFGKFLDGLAGTATSAGTGFIGMLVSLGQTLMGALGTAIQTILPPLLQFAQVLIGMLMPVIQAILPMITALAAIFGAALSGNLTALPGLINNLFSAFSGLIGVIANTVIPGIINFVTQIIVALIGMLPQLIVGAIQLFTGLITAVAQILPLVVGAVVQLIASLITAIVGLLPTLITAFVNGLTGLITALTTILPTIITTLVSAFTQILTSLLSLLPGIITTIVNIIPVLITAIVGLLPTLITAGITLFTGLITALLTALPQILTALIGALPQIFTAIVNAIPQIIEAGIQLILGLIIAIVTAIPQVIVALVQAIPQILIALVNAIPLLIKAGIQLFIALVTALVNAIPQIVDGISKQMPNIIKAFSDAGPKLLDAGKQLIQGLINGIGQMGNALWNAAQKIAGKAIDAIKNFFGIHSPSRVFAQIGVFTIQGLINGITSMTRGAVDAVQGVAAAVAGVPMQVSGLQGVSDTINASRSLAIQGAQIAVDTRTDELNKIGDALQAIADKDTVRIEKVDINNPEPEPASDSLPTTLRKMADV